jgi:hypothetical protein
MKISKSRLKSIIMQEVKNLTERRGDRKGDEGAGKDKKDKPDFTTDARKGDKGKGKKKKDKPDFTTDARKGDKGKGKKKGDKPDFTTKSRKGDKGKGKKKKDKPDYSTGARKGDKGVGHKWKDYEKKPKNRKDAKMNEDSSEEEEAHDDANIDRLRRIRSELDDHIRELEDQHDRARDHGERDD